MIDLNGRLSIPSIIACNFHDASRAKTTSKESVFVIDYLSLKGTLILLTYL